MFFNLIFLPILRWFSHTFTKKWYIIEKEKNFINAEKCVILIYFDILSILFSIFLHIFIHWIDSLDVFFFIFTAFIIKHFSDTVQYQSIGFLEKNRDTISKELVNVMRESNLPICRKLMSFNDTNATNKEISLDGRVKVNAAKHLVSKSKPILW